MVCSYYKGMKVWSKESIFPYIFRTVNEFTNFALKGNINRQQCDVHRVIQKFWIASIILQRKVKEKFLPFSQLFSCYIDSIKIYCNF